MVDTSETRLVDFFISRADADKALAAEIGHILEGAGHRVILQQWDFANRSFMQQMQAALNSGARVIALLSPEYMKSQHCEAEWQAAIAHDPLNRNGRLIVMRVTECTPAGLLAALVYWDLVPVRGDVAVLPGVVLDAVREGRRKDAPGAASAYWREAETILHPAIRAVPSFTGRREDLAALSAALSSGTPAAITQAAVQGLGGVGKSVLAIQYAWNSRERYAGVWRLEAESQAGIRTGLVQLGARFIRGLNEVPDQGAAAQAALDFIADGGFAKPWLLIYDNVETPETLDGLTPRAGAHVLITSRWPDWLGRAAPVPLGVFTPQEAVRYFLARTGRADEAGAARLAAALGRLPLALDHAAACCVRSGRSFGDYGERLAERIKLAPKGAAYPQTVSATFSLAIEKAAAACPEAEKLMALLAWMAPDNFPCGIIPERVMDATALDGAIAALNEVSLLTVAAGGEGGPLVSVHRLVQLVMRGRLEAGGTAEDTAGAALALVAEVFPNLARDARNWTTCEQLYPHALAVLVTAPKTGEQAEKAALLQNQVICYLECRASCHLHTGDYDKAIYAFGNAVEFDPTRPENFLGRGVSYAAKGDLSAAERQLEIALCIDPDFTACRAAMGQVKLEQGRVDDAIVHMKCCLDKAPEIDDYKRLLGHAYICKAYEDWKMVGPGAPVPPGRYASSSHIANARELRAKAAALGCQAPDLAQLLTELDNDIGRMTSRRPRGNWWFGSLYVLIGMGATGSDMLAGTCVMAVGLLFFISCLTPMHVYFYYAVLCKTPTLGHAVGPPYKLPKKNYKIRANEILTLHTDGITAKHSDGTYYLAVKFLLTLATVPIATLWNSYKNYVRPGDRIAGFSLMGATTAVIFGFFTALGGGQSAGTAPLRAAPISHAEYTAPAALVLLSSVYPEREFTGREFLLLPRTEITEMCIHVLKKLEQGENFLLL